MTADVRESSLACYPRSSNLWYFLLAVLWRTEAKLSKLASQGWGGRAQGCSFFSPQAAIFCFQISHKAPHFWQGSLVMWEHSWYEASGVWTVLGNQARMRKRDLCFWKEAPFSISVRSNRWWGGIRKELCISSTFMVFGLSGFYLAVV